MTDPSAPTASEPTVPSTSTNAVQQAVAALAAGRMVVVVDDADREDEGDLIVPAATVTHQQIAFIVRNTTGILCAPMTASGTAPDRFLGRFDHHQPTLSSPRPAPGRTRRWPPGSQGPRRWCRPQGSGGDGGTSRALGRQPGDDDVGRHPELRKT